jgi:hypothetical protein
MASSELTNFEDPSIIGKCLFNAFFNCGTIIPYSSVGDFKPSTGNIEISKGLQKSRMKITEIERVNLYLAAEKLIEFEGEVFRVNSNPISVSIE